MSERDDGGSAFPSANDVTVGDYRTAGHAGMTLRDYFAAKAIDEASRLERASPTGLRGEATYSGIAMRAYIIADAMLEARKS
jgi:hypothetical protein